MPLKIRIEAICQSAASILKGHIHNNRLLYHDSFDNEVMLPRYTSLIHLSNIHWMVILAARRRKMNYFTKRVNNIKHGNLYNFAQLR
jgi:hypothetical protein